MHRPPSLTTQKGFSLIELMIVVAIIGIISLIALPIYSNYLIRIRYTQLITHMLQIDKLIEIQAAGGNEDMPTYFIDTVCDLTSVADDPVNADSFTCKASDAFTPPTNTVPNIVDGRNTVTVKKYIDNGSFFYTGSFFYGSNYIMLSGIYNVGDGTKMININVQGKDIGKIYGSTDTNQPFLATMLIAKGPTVKLKNGKGQDKKADLIWYCGFNTNGFASSLPPIGAIPSVCRHYKISVGNLNPIFQEMY